MSSEMAKIADDLDSFVHDLREEGSSDATALWLEQRASALRRIAAAGEQKPVARLREALELHTICDDCGNSSLAHDRAVWTDDGSSFCPGCFPKDAGHVE